MTVGIGKFHGAGPAAGSEVGGTGESPPQAPKPKQVKVHVRHPLESRPARQSSDPTTEVNLKDRRQRATTLLARQQSAERAASAVGNEGQGGPAAAGSTQLLTFQEQETPLGIELHRVAAEEPLAPAEAELKYQQLLKKVSARKALLNGGPPGANWQVVRAVFGEGLNLGLIASFGFNGWNVTAQMLIAKAVRERLPPHLSPEEREAICGAATFMGASFAAGFGALGASIFWAPMGVGAAQQATGAWEIQKQDLELLFPNPDPYVDRDQGITKSRREYEVELRTACSRASSAKCSRAASDWTR